LAIGETIRRFVFRFRFEEIGSIIFIIPIFCIIVITGDAPRLIRDAEKISLLLAIALIFMLRSRSSRPSKYRVWGILRDFGPLFYVLVIYSNLPWLIDTINPRNADLYLIRIDQLCFGTQLSAKLGSLLWEPLISFATISYATYYLFPPLLAIVLYIKGKYRAFRNLSAAVLLSFFIGYIGYILVPAVGPRYTISSQYSEEIKGYRFTQLVRQKLDDWEYTKRDCFPSLHNMVILVTLIFSFKYERKFAWLFLPFALGLFFGTVYLRYHYVIDVLAGWILAVGCCLWGPAILRYWDSRQLRYGYKETI